MCEKIKWFDCLPSMLVECGGKKYDLSLLYKNYIKEKKENYSLKETLRDLQEDLRKLLEILEKKND